MSYVSFSSFASTPASGSALDLSGRFTGDFRLCPGVPASVVGDHLELGGAPLRIFGGNVTANSLWDSARSSGIATFCLRVGVSGHRHHLLDGDSGGSDSLAGLVDYTVTTDSTTLVAGRQDGWFRAQADYLGAGLWLTGGLYDGRRYRSGMAETGGIDTMSGTSDSGHRSAKLLLQVRHPALEASLQTWLSETLLAANPYRSGAKWLCEPNIAFYHVLNEADIHGLPNSASAGAKAYGNSAMNAAGVAGTLSNSLAAAQEDWAAAQQLATYTYWTGYCAAQGVTAPAVFSNWGNAKAPYYRSGYAASAVGSAHDYEGNLGGSGGSPVHAIDAATSWFGVNALLREHGKPFGLDEIDFTLGPHLRAPAMILAAAMARLQGYSWLHVFQLLGSGALDVDTPASISYANNPAGLFILRAMREAFEHVEVPAGMPDEPAVWASDSAAYPHDLCGAPFTRLISHAASGAGPSSAVTWAESLGTADGRLAINPHTGAMAMGYSRFALACATPWDCPDARYLKVLSTTYDVTVLACPTDGLDLDVSKSVLLGILSHQVGSSDSWRDGGTFTSASARGGTSRVYAAQCSALLRTNNAPTMSVAALGLDGQPNGKTVPAPTVGIEGLTVQLDTALGGTGQMWYLATSP